MTPNNKSDIFKQVSDTRTQICCVDILGKCFRSPKELESMFCSSQRWNRPQVISCFSSSPPTHSHYLAGEDRGRQWLPPGQHKCQVRDFGCRDMFYNPNPTVTKTKAEFLSLEPTCRDQDLHAQQREGMAVLYAARRR